MIGVNYILYTLKILFLNLITVFICYKLVNIKISTKKEYIKIFFSNIAIISICIFVKIEFGETMYSSFIAYLGICFLMNSRLENNLGYTMLVTIIAFAICYIIFAIAVGIAYIFTIIFSIKNNFFMLCIIVLIHILITFILFKMKRLKDGITFLKNKSKNIYLDITMFSISSIVLYLYSLVTYKSNFKSDVGILYSGENVTRYLVINFFIFGIILIMMIQKTLLLSYKQNLLENTIKDYEKTIKEKDEKINRLSDEKFKINKLNHEFYNRQKSLELKVEKALQNMNFELSEEFDLGDKILELSKEYTNKVIEIKRKNELPKTDIEEIDDMFSYMQSECIKNGIEFILQVNGNIHYLINNIINKNKLVTLIGDHLRDAIIAINYSDNKYKSVFAILGIKDDVYEFCIYDSGIEFEIETFRKLGLEPATTHKDNGGTGIGFITTFETLKETKASLIIEEKNELMENSYTKAVKFRFDDKNEFKIISYRANDIKENINSNRILIQKFNPQ